MKALRFDVPNLPMVVDIEPNIVSIARMFGVRQVRAHRLSWTASDGLALLAVYPGAGPIPLEPAPLLAQRPVLIVGAGPHDCRGLSDADVFYICAEVLAQEKELVH